jgi:hypothetical protein
MLTGTIPAELGNLTYLAALDLADNSLDGAIPAELSMLGSMEQLYLDGNSILMCWSTKAARDWALGLPSYTGPVAICAVAGEPPGPR